MTKFEEEFNYLIELSGKVLIGQVDAEAFEKNRVSFFEKYETDQQQALPVVPECVAEYIKQSKGFLSFYGALFGIFNETDTELHEWVKGKRKLEVFARAWLDGYTVEKTKRFYLKNKLSGLWLVRDKGNKTYSFNHTMGMSNADEFTQEEIDSIDTGSYEKIEVVKDDI